MSGVAATAAVTIRLKALLAGAANVWNTLDTTVDPKAFRERYVNAKKIHSYEVTREGSEPIEGGSSQSITRRERVVVYGFYSYEAGVSEPLFQAEVDKITNAFDAPRLRKFEAEGDVALGIEWSGAPSVEGPRQGRLGEVVVHYVRITIPVEFDPIF